MLIIGYRGNPDWAKVKAAFKRCTDLDASEIADIISKVKKGQTMTLIEDFVLREELKELGILLQ